MELSFRFTNIALQDLEAVNDWYQDIHVELLHRFADDLNQTIKAIVRNPNGFSFYYKDYRKISLAIYPYKVFYIVKKEEVIIVRILHHKLKPSTIKKRIKKQ